MHILCGYTRGGQRHLMCPLDVYYDMWNELITYLIAYAYAICSRVDPDFAAYNQPER